MKTQQSQQETQLKSVSVHIENALMQTVKQAAE